MSCRICSADTREVLDLGASPPANRLKVSPSEPEDSYPLVLEWCETCGNVQLRDTLPAEVLYRDYFYVTPQSSMLESHYEYLTSYLLANGYAGEHSFVVEPGSNAGHFLAHLRPSVGSVLGIDPAERIAQMANDAGVPTICDFFDPRRAADIADSRGLADLVVARHCLAHNPSPHEMVSAAAALLPDSGHLVIENAYVLNTVENTEFDQIYHEHMFYFSIRSMKKLLELHGMRLVDVIMSLVHGGSIIFIAQKGLDGPVQPSVPAYESREAPTLKGAAFEEFASRTHAIRARLTGFLQHLRREGRSIHAYGATAKGSTLLNYMGFTSDEIPFCVDSTPMKQGRFLPRSNLRIISEEESAKDPPDYYLLTAWNYQDEIIGKVRASGNYRSRFIIPIPFVRIV